MSVESVRKAVADLGQSVEVFGALGATLVAQRNGINLQPDVQAALEGVLAAAGIVDPVFDAAEGLDRLIGNIRSQLLQAAAMTEPHALEPGWSYTSREILEAQGQGSGVGSWRRIVFPRTPGLEDRLQASGGAFLDVGVGVAGIAIAAAKMWPMLRVVGIDPWEPALSIARENVEREGLQERIQLQLQTAQDLIDAETFDLVWLPTGFMPANQMSEILTAVHRAMRRGGWVMCIVRPTPADALGQALEVLRTATRGSLPQDANEVARLLEAHRFQDVQFVTEPGSPIFVIANRGIQSEQPFT